MRFRGLAMSASSGPDSIARARRTKRSAPSARKKAMYQAICYDTSPPPKESTEKFDRIPLRVRNVL